MMTIRRLHSVTLALICALWLVPPQDASAEELSSRELRKILRKADKAVKKGSIDEAVDGYGRALDALPEGDRRRANALYYTAMSELSSSIGTEAAAVAKDRLDELARAFPRYEHGLEVAVARALLADLDAGRAELERSRSELEAKAAAMAQEASEASESEKEASADDGKRIKSLEAQLRKARAELSETRSELEKKEEALQKLKDALVGRAGASG